jgi:uncharacterized protein YyaL (SSP411 family)
VSHNRLIEETSPYLLQHAHNPVGWYPWGDEAFEAARKHDKPVFLSVGYSACHWCHVMSHESFENEAIAAIMNAHFINVKVDREERPDVDEIYMNALQLMTQQGGWPMSVFLTPDGRPFYGGTYFPPESRYGRPGFGQVLESIATTYREKREDITKASTHLFEGLERLGRLSTTQGGIEPDLVERGAVKLSQNIDDRFGGFGTQPKFPNAMNLDLLLDHYVSTGDTDVLNCVTLTLDKMAAGGIYDQLGGGFHRYSVDHKWLVPHFEKMLYDNALLARLYTRAYGVTKDPLYEKVAVETLDYVLKEMTSPEGGFWSTQDADSEGEEGKFFVWTPEEVEAALGEKDAQAFCAYFDVTPTGNFEGRNILNVPHDAESVAHSQGITVNALHEAVERGRAALIEVRRQRVAPGRDDKIQANWNGLMISAMSWGARMFGHARFSEAASRAARFILDGMRQDDGRLWHSYKDGRARFNGYHDDYACVVNGLVDLYETTFERSWLNEAGALIEVMVDQFWDDDAGGFYYTGKDHEALIVRSKNPYDNATPSGNAVAATALLRFAALTGRADLVDLAESTIRLFLPFLRDMPAGFGQMLLAAGFMIKGPTELVFAGDPEDPQFPALVRVGRQAVVPNLVLASRSAGHGEQLPIAVDRVAVAGGATAYVCKDRVCSRPLHDVDTLRNAL